MDTFVRTDKEVATVGSATIFPEDGQEGITIHVGFLQQKFPDEVARKLAAVRTAHDEFHVAGVNITGSAASAATNRKSWTLPEIKALKLPTSTMRNLTSIRKLIAKHLV
ncbi:MAG: hypothetical protein WDN00_15620 [Limisphaerales bacterium]